MRIFLTLFLAIVSLLSFYTGIDEKAIEIYEGTLDRAVYSFALVKGLNAIISVLQSTEINMSLFVGATVGIGQILDPINDLVERFSVVMLFASVSIGIQHLLLFLGKNIFIKVLLALFSSVVIIGIWMQKNNYFGIIIFSLKIVLFLFILRFGAIIFVYTTELIYTNVYSQEYKKSNHYILNYKNDLEVIQSNKQEFNTLWTKLKDKTEIFSKKIIALITMFVITTVLLPLSFIWFYIYLIKIIFNIKFDYDIISSHKKKEEI